MLRNILLILLISINPLYAMAETKETERLAKITEDYAKCADVVLGNFANNEEAQKAIKVLYGEMIANIKEIISLESKSDSSDMRFLVDFMGVDVFTGYMLKGFSDVDQNYQDNKKSLKEKYNFDWRQVNTELWSKHGCSAIYRGLTDKQ